MTMARIRELIDGLIEREGGYVAHPDDPGGATCWGITEHVALRNGYTGPMQDLPLDRAFEIYLNQYFFGPGFDRVLELSVPLGEEITDTGVNMGPATATRFLQRALNAFNQQTRLYRDLAVDGYIGELTLAALDVYLEHRGQEGEAVMLRALNSLQGARYIELAEDNHDLESFTFGWFRARVE